ncbi:MAG: PDZ domain-containing protein [Pyrinomonadaceae bacterium]|nr:PDZ domain-containing protein [Pyrinomonadaceae bacterium]
MIRKLSVFICLTISVSAVAFAQQTPEPNRKNEGVFNFVLGGGSYLGVQTQEISKENFAKYGLVEVRGVAVEKVVENSPAADAGIQNGDVIIRFNGEEVTGTRKLSRLIAEIAPDHQAKITVLRNGTEREFTVTIGKREMPELGENGAILQGFPQMSEMPLSRIPLSPNMTLPPMDEDGNVLILRNGESRQIGVSVTQLTKQLAENFGVSGGRGLLIENVRENSPAAKAGLKAGDVIVEADGKEVKNSLELIRALNAKKEGDVSLTIVREKNRQTINVTPQTVKSNFVPMFERREGIFPPGNLRLAVPAVPSVPLTLSAPVRLGSITPANILFPGISCL